ncbi:hypothetical protein BJ742DRAFT_843849 [Cladochytrium replicatum]|nr:hypothetical protein BJ742DRAFT_843849 [Cladochytrium replicatum]
MSVVVNKIQQIRRSLAGVGTAPLEAYPLGGSVDTSEAAFVELKRSFDQAISELLETASHYANALSSQQLPEPEKIPLGAAAIATSLLCQDMAGALRMHLGAQRAPLDARSSEATKRELDGKIFSDPSSSPILYILRGIAKSFGLESSDNLEPILGGPGSTITMWGKTFVVDVEISTTNEVTKVVLSRIGDSEESEEADRFLTRILRDRQFTRVTDTLSTFVAWDTANDVPGLDWFWTMKKFEVDLKTIFASELAHVHGNSRSVLLGGHGVPALHGDRFGPCLFFWAKAPWLNRHVDAAKPDPTSWTLEKHKEGVCRGYITLQPSSVRRAYLPKPVYSVVHPEQVNLPISQEDSSLYIRNTRLVPGLQGLTHVFNVPIQTHSPLSADLTYALRFEPGVFLSLHKAQLLAAMSASDDISSLNPLAYQNVPDELNDYENLFDRLVPELNDNRRFDERGCRDKHSPAVIVRNVPFADLSAVLPIFNVLRQQLVFNHLIQLFMGQPKENEPLWEYGKSVELLSWSPPDLVTFMLLHSLPPFSCQVELAVSNGLSGAASGSVLLSVRGGAVEGWGDGTSIIGGLVVKMLEAEMGYPVMVTN